MEGYWKVYFCSKGIDYLAFLEEISNDCDKALWYFHPGGKKDSNRPHIHGLVINYSKSDDTLRKKIKDNFPVDAKKQEFAISNSFSRGVKMSELFYQKYITYMSKGIYDPVYNKGFTIQEVEVFKSLWIFPDEGTQPANIVIEPKEKVIKKLTLFQIARAAQCEYLAIYKEIDINISKLIYIVIRLLKENRILAHKMTVRNIIQDIIADLDAEEFVSAVYKMV